MVWCYASMCDAVCCCPVTVWCCPGADPVLSGCCPDAVRQEKQERQERQGRKTHCAIPVRVPPVPIAQEKASIPPLSFSCAQIS
jgi:hypothetical protein